MKKSFKKGMATIDDGQTPLANAEGSWALINLISMILTAICSLLLIIFAVIRKRHEEDEETNNKYLVRAASLIPAVLAVIAFFLTEDMSLQMQLTDKWTLMMLIILAVEIITAVFARKTNEEDDSEEAEYEAA